MRIQIRPWMPHAGIGIGAFGVGVCAGYFLGTYRTKKKLEEIDTEIEGLKSEQLRFDFQRAEEYREFDKQLQQASIVIKDLKETSKLYLEQFHVDPQNLGDYRMDPVKLEEVWKGYAGHPGEFKSKEPEEVITESENIMINVFPHEDDDWDYKEELKHRSNEHPYIIHRDEYFSNEMDFSQSSLTYYEGDNILCDEQDVPIYNPEKIVGKLIFGHGSLDPSICFVRNEKLEGEYEVIIDHGFYQAEILGNDVSPEVRHSHRAPKFKRE